MLTTLASPPSKKQAGNVFFNMTEERAEDWLGQKVALFSDEVLSSKADALHAALLEGFRAGEGINKLTNRVMGVYDGVLDSKYQAQRIARTETISASNAGKFEGYQQSQVVEEKIWVSTIDMRTRGADLEDKFDHKKPDGQKKKLDEPFVVSGQRLMFPGDHSRGASGGNIIHCRCTFRSVVKKPQSKSWEELSTWEAGKPWEEDLFKQNAERYGLEIFKEKLDDKFVREYIVLDRDIKLYHGTTRNKVRGILERGLTQSMHPGNARGVYMTGNLETAQVWHGAKNSVAIEVRVPAGTRLYRDVQPNAVFIRRDLLKSEVRLGPKPKPITGVEALYEKYPHLDEKWKENTILKKIGRGTLKEWQITDGRIGRVLTEVLADIVEAKGPVKTKASEWLSYRLSSRCNARGSIWGMADTVTGEVGLKTEVQNDIVKIVTSRTKPRLTTRALEAVDTLCHEFLHMINPVSPAIYKTPYGSMLEEGLTEWATKQVLDDFTKVLYIEQYSSHGYVSYKKFVDGLKSVARDLVATGKLPKELNTVDKVLKHLKFEVNPTARTDVIAKWSKKSRGVVESNLSAYSRTGRSSYLREITKES